MTKVKYEDDHLKNLYLKWKNDPKSYDEEIKTTVDKIIFTTMRKSFNKRYKINRLQEHDDIVQDLRVTCFKALNKIEEPITNKRIFNYLSFSVSTSLKGKARSLAKFIDTEHRQVNLDKVDNLIQIEDDSFPVNFGNQFTNQIAYLLSQGCSKHQIMKQLNLTQTKLTREINKIKGYYE